MSAHQVDSDDYFELMMRNAWHISGGDGRQANTSNLRVLVRRRRSSTVVWMAACASTHAAAHSCAGLQVHFAGDLADRVVMVEHDLGLPTGDWDARQAEIVRRLIQQGLRGIRSVST